MITLVALTKLHCNCFALALPRSKCPSLTAAPPAHRHCSVESVCPQAHADINRRISLPAISDRDTKIKQPDPGPVRAYSHTLAAKLCPSCSSLRAVFNPSVTPSFCCMRLRLSTTPPASCALPRKPYPLSPYPSQNHEQLTCATLGSHWISTRRPS
jgi:hypothetical protein